MKFIYFYFIGWLVATIWTFAKMWRKDFCDESRWMRLVFSVILGIMSWLLVIIYGIMLVYDKEKEQQKGE